MDIHKPKPFHSVKEFFSEIIIIVTGIVIALGGEQVVERFHWAHAIETERQALMSDIKVNLEAVAIRAAQRKCVDDRLADLAVLFSRHKAGQPLGSMGPVGRPQPNSAGGEVWQVAVADQTINRMPMEEHLAFADAFTNFKHFYGLEQDVDSVWITLSALDRPELLEPEDWSRLRDAYTRVLADEERVSFIADFVLTHATMGLAVPTIDLDKELVMSNGKALCRPLWAK